MTTAGLRPRRQPEGAESLRNVMLLFVLCCMFYVLNNKTRAHSDNKQQEHSDNKPITLKFSTEINTCREINTDNQKAPRACWVCTEVTFGRGDLSVCPYPWPYRGPGVSCFKLEGCSPGVPTGTNTKSTSPSGHLCAPLIEALRAWRKGRRLAGGGGGCCRDTPGLHNKIPALKIFAMGWVAQESIVCTINALIFQGLRPKRRESCNGDRVYGRRKVCCIAGGATCLTLLV